MARVTFANDLRGMAALAVLVGHYTGGFWGGRDEVANLIGAPALTMAAPALFQFINATPLHWGPFGVALFFLISGFVIPFSFNRYKPGGFIVGRLLRIYPVYIVGFSLTLIALVASHSYFTGSDRLPYFASHIAAHYLPGLRDTLNYPSIDGIIWTLEVELRFYLVCVLAYPLMRSETPKILLVPLGIVALLPIVAADIPGVFAYTQAIYTPVAYGKSVLIYIIYMFVGVAFSLHFRGKLTTGELVLAAGLLASAFLAAFATGPQKEVWASISFNYGAALAVFSAAYVARRSWRSNPVFSFFAKISYPLYVVHGVCGFVIMRLMAERGASPWSMVLTAFAAATTLAFILHLLVERPTQLLGRWIGDGVGRSGDKRPRVAPTRDQVQGFATDAD